jgi:hypothetical protein
MEQTICRNNSKREVLSQNENIKALVTIRAGSTSTTIQKIGVGGSFAARLILETVRLFVNCHFSVFIKASRPVSFVDGPRAKCLHPSIDPGMTAVGREAIAKHAQVSEQRENSSQEKRKREAAEVQDLLEI